MRTGSGLVLLLSLVSAGGCGVVLRPPVDGDVPGAATDASASDAAGSSLCNGAPALAGWTPDVDTPYVTLSDDSGRGCVFTLGESEADAQACGANRPSALIEPGCSFTSLAFTVWGNPYIDPEFAVQGAYAFMERSGRLQNGRVNEMTVDSASATITRGHFQVAFDATADLPAATASGTFALCATSGVTVEPCRQP